MVILTYLSSTIPSPCRNNRQDKAQPFSLPPTIANNKKELALMNTLINNTMLRLLKVFSAIMLGGFLSSCAMMEAQQAKDTEQLLAAAGFKMKLADTPAKMVHLKTLSQNKIVPHEKDGVVYYIYADAATCLCFFWGRDQSYQNFLQLQDQQNIANDERMTAEMNEQEYLDWDMMGYDMGGNGMGFN